MIDAHRQPIFLKTSCISQEVWQASDGWRARECYNYICRKLLQRYNLKRWNDFDWNDYIERCHFSETFKERHLPVMRGFVTLTDDELKPPAMWSQRAQTLTATATSRASKTTNQRKSVRANLVATTAPTLMWDFKTETWVKNNMGSQSPAAFAPITKSMTTEEPKTTKRKKTKRKTRGKKSAPAAKRKARGKKSAPAAKKHKALSPTNGIEGRTRPGRK